MPSLNDAIAASFFGTATPPDAIDVGLTLLGSEPQDPRYTRVRVPRGGWVVEDGVAKAAVRFGPFAQAVTVDAAVLFIAGERVEVLPFDGHISLLAGMALEYDVEVAVR